MKTPPWVANPAWAASRWVDSDGMR